MSDNKDCGLNHEYVGEASELKNHISLLPVSCHICRNIYFSDNIIRIKTAMGNFITLCPDCSSSVKCSRCQKNLILENSVIAECSSCGKIALFCDQCAENMAPIRENKGKDPIQSKYKDIIDEGFFHLRNFQDLNIPSSKKGDTAASFNNNFLIYFFMPDIIDELNELDDEELDGAW